MLGWLVGKIKWLFLIAMFGGPFMAYTSWQDGEHIKTVAEKGVATEALVKGATKTKRRRGGTSSMLTGHSLSTASQSDSWRGGGR